MIKKLKQIKSFYIFNTIAVLLLLFSIYGAISFQETKHKIEFINFQSSIDTIDNITDNIVTNLKEELHSNFYDTLKKNPRLQKILQKQLQLFSTKKYKYIYIVDNHFRFLVDGEPNKEERADFGENYQPLNREKWLEVQKTKQTLFFTHKNNEVQSVWLTYLKPVLVNGNIEAIIVIDFSLKEVDMIKKSLHDIDYVFIKFFIFIGLVFITMILFSYLDRRREKQKDIIANQLKYKNKEIEHMNQNLQEEIKNEVKLSRQKDQQMIQQARLAQMGEMLSMIAHQWRQPLSAISASSANIHLKAQLKQLDSKEITDLTNNIMEYSQHLSTTINDFRNFFKSHKNKKTTSYTELLNSVLLIVEASIIDKNIHIVKELECQDTFESYEGELKQVVLNLIKNAEDALLDNPVKDPYIKLKTYKEKNHLILEISDNAGGIPKNILSKIFDPYFSTKRKKEGTGLGLYMSKTIIEEHCGGKLIASNDEYGAVFKVILK